MAWKNTTGVEGQGRIVEYWNDEVRATPGADAAAIHQLAQMIADQIVALVAREHYEDRVLEIGWTLKARSVATT